MPANLSPWAALPPPSLAPGDVVFDKIVANSTRTFVLMTQSNFEGGVTIQSP